MSRIEGGPGGEWQRLDLWLWCARVMKARSECARLIESGAVRLNGQSTEKAHARVRPGDVVVFALRGRVQVLRIQALAERRGPPAEARVLYEELGERQPDNGELATEIVAPQSSDSGS